MRDNPEGESELAKGPTQLQPKYKAVVTPLADLPEDEVRKDGPKVYENWKQAQPDLPVRDDRQPGDRNPLDPGVDIIKERDVQGYTLQQRNPHGRWYIVNLPDLGSYMTYKDACAGLMKYLEKKQLDATS